MFNSPVVPAVSEVRISQGWRKWSISALLALAASVNASATTTAGPNMSVPRSLHTASRLADGTILLAGGDTQNGNPSGITQTADLYNPATGTLTRTGSMLVARAQQGAAVLPNGKVLVLGGLGPLNTSFGALNSAEIYDPVSHSWSTAGSLNTARQQPLVVTLGDGRVLITMGDQTHASTEIYDPVAGVFQMSGALNTPRYNASIALLHDGRVLVAGGSPVNPGPFYNTAEVWNPATGTWTTTGSMAAARADASATTLSNGKVLIAGGTNNGSSALASAELYDPASGTFSPTGSLNAAHAVHSAVMQADGNVVISGGVGNYWIASASIERYNVTTGTWQTAGAMNATRQGHSMSLLPNGNVLITGGSAYSGDMATTELFDPVCSAAIGTLSPAVLNLPSTGGSGSVNVAMPAGCGWSVQQLPTWMAVSGGTGVGNGSFTYSAAANTTAGGRGAQVAVANTILQANEAAPAPVAPSGCGASTVSAVTPIGAGINAAGGWAMETVTANAGCVWTVSNIPSWITVYGKTGTGSGSFWIDIAQNYTGMQRVASVTISNKTFVVTQLAR